MESNPYQSPVHPNEQPQPRANGGNDYAPFFAMLIVILAIPWAIICLLQIVETLMFWKPA